MNNDIINLETKNVIPFEGEFLSFCDGGNTIMITKTAYGEKYYELKKYLSFINPDNGKEYLERRIKLPGSVRVAFECYNGRLFVGLENGISCVYRHPDTNNHVWEKFSLPFQYSYYSGYSWQTRDKCRIIKEEGCKFSSNLKYAIIRQEDSLHIYELFGKKYSFIRSLNFPDRILSITSGAPIIIAKHIDILDILEDTLFNFRREREITSESVVLYNIDNNSKLLVKKDTCYVVSIDGVMSISDDGRFVAYPYGNTILLKDAQCDSIKNKMNGHFNTINSITFSADGKYIVSTSCDNTIRVWQVSNGKELDDKRICYPIEEHIYVERAVLSPNNKYIAVLISNHVDLYDFEKNSLIETITMKEQINTIDFSEDCKSIYALCETGIFVREIPSFEVLYNRYKHLRNYKLNSDERKQYFLQ